MKTVICIEGADGSGKSTLSKHIVARCQSLGWSCQIIGRRAADSTADIGRVTALSQELDQESPPQAGFHLRIAREYLRADQCRRSDADIVILDRFVLSVLSRIRVDGESGSTFLPHLKDIAVRSTLAATIYCDCSFETAWDRVNAEVRNGGRAALSPKEMKGPIYLRRLHDAIKADFDRLDWIGAKYSIATDRGIETMMDQCGPLFGSLLQARDS